MFSVLLHKVQISLNQMKITLIFSTYDGIRGGGRPGVERAGGGPPGPGRLGIAGAGRPPVGTGGGARELERGGGCVTPRLGPPGDGGDNL